MRKKSFIKTIKPVFVFLLIFSMLGGMGCSNAALSEPITVTGYKLNTYVRIDSYTNVSKSVLQEALNLCDTYEKLFSRTLTESTLYKVNSGEITDIPEELGLLIQYGLDYSRLSGGAFDITIGSVSRLWDFTADKPVVPDSAEIIEALKYVDYKNVSLAKNADGNYHIEMPENTILDLGAIAKGYIADRIKDYLLANNVTSAVINLGGNVLCVGGKSSSNDFVIGVKKPFTQTNEVLVTLKLNDISAVSSGTYERYFYDGDTFYHHILNPKTGYPYENALTSVTILSRSSVDGDCLSTTCFALGLDDGMALIESLPDTEAVFVTEDGSIHYSGSADKYFYKA